MSPAGKPIPLPIMALWERGVFPMVTTASDLDKDYKGSEREAQLYIKITNLFLCFYGNC